MNDLETALPAVRRKLNITWHDQETEDRLKDIVETGISTMAHKLGAPPGFSFAADPAAFWLLREWCFYEWNHRAAQFSADYSGEIEQHRARLMREREEDANGDGV